MKGMMPVNAFAMIRSVTRKTTVRMSTFSARGNAFRGLQVMSERSLLKDGQFRFSFFPSFRLLLRFKGSS